jgi:hypothetical protein
MLQSVMIKLRWRDNMHKYTGTKWYVYEIIVWIGSYITGDCYYFISNDVSYNCIIISSIDF